MLHRLCRLRGDERGQSLIFGVMTIFLVLFLAAMILCVGQVTARRIQMQFAADAAAYSSALVESDCLNAIALLNTAMAQVRARALRYAADVNAYGVLCELRDRVLNQGQQSVSSLDAEILSLQQQLAEETDPSLREELTLRINRLIEVRDSLREEQAGFEPVVPPGVPDPLWVQQIVGMNRADEAYAEGYSTAEKWIPAANEWLRELSRMEHTIAILAPRLAAETAYTVARENGGECASIFPCSRWLPRDNAYLSLDIYRLGEQWWRVEGPQTVIEVMRDDSQQDCPRPGECVSCWVIYWRSGATDQGMYRIWELEQTPEGNNRWIIENLVAAELICIEQHDEMYVVTYGPEGVAVTYHDMPGGRWLELTNLQGTWPHNTFFVRTRNGIVEYTRYQWDAQQKRWVMPEDDDFVALSVTSVNVDGVPVNVNLDAAIRVGSATVWLTVPASIDLGWARITLCNPIRVTATINGINVSIRDESFAVGRRGCLIPMRDADGIWRTYYDRGEEYWWQHRLNPVDTDQWQYEYMEFGARMRPETNMARLLAHRDIERAGTPGGMFADCGFVPDWAYDPGANLDGWLDAGTGALVRGQAGADPDAGALAAGAAAETTYRYYQWRPCWDPLDTHVPRGAAPPPGEPDGRWEFDFNGDGVIGPGETMICPTCGGRGYVLVQPSAVFGRRGQLVRGALYPHQDTISDNDYQQADFKPEHVPLVLSEEFFKYGVTVGVWHGRESHFGSSEGGRRLERPVEYLLHDPSPGMKGIMTDSGQGTGTEEILRPSWGYFALAGARPRFNPRQEALGALIRQGMYFSCVTDRAFWVEQGLGNLYLLPSGSAWSYWDASLVALSRQVLDDDVILGQDASAETGTGWLLKRIARGAPWGWAEEFDLQGVPEVGGRLTGAIRPRRPYPRFGRPYLDEEGLLRDPLVEYLGARGQGAGPRGGQLDYNRLDEQSVLH